MWHGRTSKAFQNFSLLLHQLLLLLLLELLIRGELFAGTAAVVVVRVFCFGAAVAGVDFCHELSALRVVVVVLEQHLSGLLVES